jgi:hypothetical protein
MGEMILPPVAQSPYESKLDDHAMRSEISKLARYQEFTIR